MPYVFLCAVNGTFMKKKQTEMEQKDTKKHKGRDETKHWTDATRCIVTTIPRPATVFDLLSKQESVYVIASGEC